MELPDFLDAARIGQLALLVAIVIQYVKDKVPEWFIKPYLQMVLGIILSWLGLAYVSGAVNPFLVPWVKVIVDGIVAALVSDFGYNFLVSKPGSPAFSLPTRTTPQ